jgi:hypothetical protein
MMGSLPNRFSHGALLSTTISSVCTLHRVLELSSAAQVMNGTGKTGPVKGHSLSR